MLSKMVESSSFNFAVYLKSLKMKWEKGNVIRMHGVAQLRVTFIKSNSINHNDVTQK